MRVLISLLTWLACSQAVAAIYEYTDSKGNRVYTNQPPTDVNSPPITLPTPNTIAPAPLETPNAAHTTPDNTPPYEQLELTNLPDTEALRANNGHFSVQVKISPPLSTQHRLQLVIDGQAYGPALYAKVLEAVNVPRGEHQVAVQVLSGKRVLQTSESHLISIQRVNLNNRAPKPTPRAAP